MDSSVPEFLELAEKGLEAANLTPVAAVLAIGKFFLLQEATDCLFTDAHLLGDLENGAAFSAQFPDFLKAGLPLMGRGGCGVWGRDGLRGRGG